MAEQLLYKLSKNQSLERVKDSIKEASVDWDKVETVFNEVVVASGLPYQEQQIPGYLAEINLGLILSQLALEDPNIINQSIPFNTRVGQFRFNRFLLGGYRVWDYAKRVNYADYDQIISAEGLQTTVEVKMSRNNDVIREAFYNKRINRLFLPIHMYSRNNCYGYMVVVPRDAVNPDKREQSFFVENGGIIAPFGQTHSEFLEGVEKIKPRILRGSRTWSFGS